MNMFIFKESKMQLFSNPPPALPSVRVKESSFPEGCMTNLFR